MKVLHFFVQKKEAGESRTFTLPGVAREYHTHSQ